MFKVGDTVLFTSENACERRNGAYPDHINHDGMIGTIYRMGHDDIGVKFVNGQSSGMIQSCELTLESEAPYKESVESKLKRFNYIKVIDGKFNDNFKIGDLLEITNKTVTPSKFETHNKGRWRKSSEKKHYIFVTDKYYEKNKDKRYVR